MNLGPDQSTLSRSLVRHCGMAIIAWSTSYLSDCILHIHSKHIAQGLNLRQLFQWKGVLSSYTVCRVLEPLCLLSAFPSEPHALHLPTASLSPFVGTCAHAHSPAAVLLLKDHHSSAGCGDRDGLLNSWQKKKVTSCSKRKMKVNPTLCRSTDTLMLSTQLAPTEHLRTPRPQGFLTWTPWTAPPSADVTAAQGKAIFKYVGNQLHILQCSGQSLYPMVFISSN